MHLPGMANIIKPRTMGQVEDIENELEGIVPTVPPLGCDWLSMWRGQTEGNPREKGGSPESVAASGPAEDGRNASFKQPPVLLPTMALPNQPCARPAIRPWSAYALFFREVQHKIRPSKQNGHCATVPFGELSRKIARHWEQMSRAEKLVYRERLKELRRAQIQAKVSMRAGQLMSNLEMANEVGVRVPMDSEGRMPLRR